MLLLWADSGVDYLARLCGRQKQKFEGYRCSERTEAQADECAESSLGRSNFQKN